MLMCTINTIAFNFIFLNWEPRYFKGITFSKPFKGNRDLNSTTEPMIMMMIVYIKTQPNEISKILHYASKYFVSNINLWFWCQRRLDNECDRTVDALFKNFSLCRSSEKFPHGKLPLKKCCNTKCLSETTHGRAKTCESRKSRSAELTGSMLCMFMSSTAYTEMHTI